MRIVPARALDNDEQRVLATLMSNPFDGVEELREQARFATVVGQCDCGCPTVEFTVPTSVATSIVSSSGRLAPVEGRVTSPSGDQVGDILLFVDDGKLSSLELVWYSDNPPSAWPPSDQIRIERRDDA